MKKSYYLTPWIKTKNVLAGVFFVLFGMLTYGQVVTIGTETNVGKAIPIEPYYGYSYSQNIYLASEVGQSGNIYKITFKGVSGINLSNSDSWVVYMANSSKAEFASTTDWVASTELTQVFSGTVTASSGNVTIELDTPFNYNGTDNLVIAVEEEKPSYNTNSDDFYASAVSTDRSIYYRNDSTNPDPTNPPTANAKQAFISNVDLDFTAVTCSAPSNLASTAVTTTSIDLSWTAGGSETAWNVEYGAAGFTQGSGTTVAVASNPYTLTGLTAATQYDVYLQADCGAANGQSDWIGPVSILTACEESTSEYCENFDSTDSGTSTNPTIPLCWSFVDGGVGYGYVYQYSSNSTPNNFRISNSSDTSGDYILVSPSTTILSDGNHRVKFMAKGSSNYVLVFGTMSDPTDASTFTELQTITFTSTNYEEHIVAIPSGTDKHFAFKHGLGGTYRSVYIDDVCFEEQPSTVPNCATNVTATPDASCGNFATAIAWQAPDTGADGYKLSIGTTAGGTDVLNMEDLGNVLTYSYTGLADTTYYYTVVPYNSVGDATSCTENSYTTFATACYCSSVPSSNDGSGVSNTNINGTDFAGTDVTYQDHTATAVDMQQAVDSTVDITFATGYTYGTNIWIDLNDNYEFESSELLYTGTSTSANPTTLNAIVTIPETASLGQHRMRIGTADSGQATPNPCYSGSYGVTLDFTVNITEAPSCLAPQGLSAGNVTTNSATITWTAPTNAPANGYEYYYSTDATAPTDTTSASGTASTTTADVMGLNPSTVYYVWVRSVCSASDMSPWTTSATFQTNCAAQDVPYTVDFETDPLCSSTQVVSGNEWSVATVQSGVAYMSGNAMRYAYNGSSAADSWFFTKGVNLTAGQTYTLAFDYGNNSTSYTEKLKVAYGTSPDASAMTNVLADYPDISSKSGAYASINFTPGASPAMGVTGTNSMSFTAATSGVYYIGFQAYSDANQYYLYVDNINLVAGILATEEVNVRDLKGVQIYPNPFQDVVNISDIKGVEKISIVDMAGRVVETFAPTKSLNLSGLNAGMYLINLSYQDGSVKTLKAIKK